MAYGSMKKPKRGLYDNMMKKRKVKKVKAYTS